MGKLRICKNPTTSLLRETFHATPVRIPESRIQPLSIMAYNGNNAEYRGNLQSLLVNPDALSVVIQQSDMANAALERTRNVDIDLGFSILDGFFKGLKMDTAAIKAAFSRVREISLSFHHVKRFYIDLGQLGRQVRENRIDIGNPSLGVFKGKGAAQMLIITDAIVSPGFSINDQSNTEAGGAIDAPLIQQYLANAKLGVKVNTEKKSTISFEGETPLTFAFSCARLEIDQATGSIAIMENVNPVMKGLNAQTIEENELASKVVLDDDDYEPLLLDVEIGE